MKIFDGSVLLRSVLLSRTVARAAPSKPDRAPAVPPSRVQAVSTASVVVKAGALAQSGSSVSPQFAPVPVDYTNKVKPTGDKTVDPLLAGGNFWWNTGAGADGSNPSAAADHTLTYSFMAATSELGGSNTAADGTGFQALSAAQKQVVRDAFDYIATVANITFTEVGSGGQIKLASNSQGGGSAGYASYPNSGGGSGQVLLANDVATFADANSWNPGGYTWEVILHEVGHALGLKHPGNYNAGGGTVPKPYLTKALDTRTNSIMSYNNDSKQMYVIQNNGAGSLSGSAINPDSYQMLDIAALQYLYGAAAAQGSKTYAFSNGGSFSRTIFDADAGSSIDLSAMTQDNVVDLRGGHFSSIGIRDPYAATGLTKEQYTAATSGGVKLSKLIGVPTYSGGNNLALAKGSKIQTVVGGSGKDTLISGAEIGGTAQLQGGAGDDSYYVASGDADVVDTGGMSDSVYVYKKSGTLWTVDAGHTVITQTDKKTGAVLSTVNITGIEHVGFWSGKNLKASGTLLFSPIQQKKTVAYVDNAAPVTPPTVSIKA